MPTIHQRLIRELPLTEQPATRMASHGAPTLSDAELLAVLVGLDDLAVAQRMLDHFGSLVGLMRADPREIQQVGAGIGPAKAAQIGAAFELGRRLLLTSRGELPQIRSPTDAVPLLRAAIGAAEQEHLVVLCLDSKNRVVKTHIVYIGTVNTSHVRVGEIFREPLRLNAVAIIVGHNHPSQDCTPSPEDVLVTRQIVQAGELLDVECLDHCIVSQSGYVSLRERGLGFAK